jgi:uncharacterized membrane protein YGL010W
MRKPGNEKPANGGSLLNLETQIAFYAQFHHHPMNQLIHMVFVPSLMLSALVWLTATPELVPLPAAVPFRGDFGFLLAAAYALYYIVLEPVAGTLYIGFLAATLAGAAWWAANVPSPMAAATVLHVMSWFLQVAVGHAHYEKRKPALLDSIFQAFVLAPLFVWLEMLFAIGYRPDLAKRVSDQAERDIAAWKRESAKAGKAN